MFARYKVSRYSRNTPEAIKKDYHFNGEKEEKTIVNMQIYHSFNLALKLYLHVLKTKSSPADMMRNRNCPRLCFPTTLKHPVAQRSEIMP